MFAEVPTGMYEAAGEVMPAHEVEQFWQRVFEEEERARTPRHLTLREEPAPEPLFIPAPAHPEGGNPDVPLKPAELRTLPTVTDLPPEPDLETTPPSHRFASGTLDWLHEIARQLTDFGELYVRDFMRARGIQRLSIERWLKAARSYMTDQAQNWDVEERRALILARLESLCVRARAAMDLKSESTALRLMALVSGVTKAEQLAGVSELAQIAAAVCAENGASMGIVIKGKENRVSPHVTHPPEKLSEKEDEAANGGE